ncbi:MAG: hypothetical protein HZC42_09565 [Candidatus Eisenbacteria bacterium]|nr:hypothetical protein [Candidatus Eisenbacteria bacterium]
MKKLVGVIVLVVLAWALPALAGAPVVGGQYRYWAFSNHNDLRDALAYWAPGPFHVQLEYWDFVRGDDQFRPEAGLHLRDARRSVYTAQWRHQRGQERFWLGTDQVLSKHVVGRAETSPIVTSDSTSWVFDAGLDYYWASYDFAQVTVIRDPREGGLWVVPLRVRLANERNDWLQLTFAPASRRTVGWAVDGKLRWLRLGVERNNRYDFTRLDNTVYTVGFEAPLRRAE